jgi:hypothetical protein
VPEGCSMAADTSEAYTPTLRENSREE